VQEPRALGFHSESRNEISLGFIEATSARLGNSHAVEQHGVSRRLLEHDGELLRGFFPSLGVA
jgi:hypothetical protein